MLRVYVVEQSGTRHLVTRYFGNADFNPEWTYSRVEIGSNSDGYHVEFEAEAGNEAPGIGGIIAIDDITFTDSCRGGNVFIFYTTELFALEVYYIM